MKQVLREVLDVHLTGRSAYLASDQLAQTGRFFEVDALPSELPSLPRGAIVVWGRTRRSPHGHISIAIGHGLEASDHVQPQIRRLRGAKNYRVFILWDAPEG